MASANRITITLSSQVEKAVFVEAERRGMPVKEICEELVELGLVSINAFTPLTPVEKFVSGRSSGFDEV